MEPKVQHSLNETPLETNTNSNSIDNPSVSLGYSRFNDFLMISPFHLFHSWHFQNSSQKNKPKMTSYKHAVVICALLAITITLAHGQFLAEKLQNPCGTKITCHECIQTQSCAWCMDPNIGDKPRCFQPSINSCPEEFTWNPSNRVQLLVDEELTRGGQMAAHGAIGQGHGASYESSSSQQSYSRNSSASESYENMYARKGASGSHRSRTQNVAYGSYTESGRIIQIAPQRVSLKLRISKLN